MKCRAKAARKHFEQIQNHNSEKLKERFKDLTGEARVIVTEWKALHP